MSDADGRPWAQRLTSGQTGRMLITAGRGYGKSVLLEALRPEGGLVIPATELLTDRTIADPGWIGIDDFDDIACADRDRLLRRLDEWSGQQIVITARSPVEPALRTRNLFVHRDATDLALTPFAVARLLREVGGSTDVEAAQEVADLTAGWPMLVRFAADALRRDPQVNLAAALSSGPAAGWLGAVLDDLPEVVHEVLRTIAAVDPAAVVTHRGCAAVAALLGQPLPPDAVETLRRTGLVVPQRRLGSATELIMVPALARSLRRRGGDVASAAVAALAGGYQADGQWLPAAQAAAFVGDRDRVAALVAEHGEGMLRRGHAAAVVSLVDEVFGPSLDTGPSPDTGPSLDTGAGLLRRTYADALRMIGDPSRARRAFAPLVAGAEMSGWTPGLACRVANLDYLCGQFEDALTVLDRCPEPPTGNPGADLPIGEDVVDWWAARVHVLAVLGRMADARGAASRCLEAAEGFGEPRPLAVAYLAAARCRRGTAKDLDHEHALRYAAQADDLMTATRVLAARTVQQLAEARYDLARSSGAEAVRLGRLCSPPGLRTAILHNLGEALARTGELDEARWHLQCAVALARRLGPARAALGLVGLADLDRLVGNAEQGLAGYAEAAELARGSGDSQVLVAALCGRALLAADSPATEADELVAEARRIAPAELLPAVLTTAGRIALARGDRLHAADLSATALVTAREVGAVDLLAEALELHGAVAGSPADARWALAEARSIWAGGGARPAVARLDVLVGGLPDADGAERSRAREAAAELRGLGIRVPSAGRRGTGSHGALGVVQIAVLGPFGAIVDGAEVPLPAWRSKQARTLVKILAAHRGRVVTRDRLCDLLWPDDDPARTGHRLSVLLATVRTVLDPGKSWPPERYIVADQHGLRLNLGAVVVDAELLLGDAAHAAELLERGEPEQAREVLAQVERLGRGDAFADETDEWADGLREEVRAAWSRSMRRLANLQLRAGRGPEALGIFARLLAVDPYDEQIHRRLVTSLVGAGRHGEARRAFDRWCRAMADLDAPQPDPREVDLAGRIGQPILTSR